jgi:hypothetical protein
MKYPSQTSLRNISQKVNAVAPAGTQIQMASFQYDIIYYNDIFFSGKGDFL